jgi:hypothetical protein
VLVYQFTKIPLLLPPKNNITRDTGPKAPLALS